MAPTYRQRLRLEGSVLAACGAVDAALLLGVAPQARRWPLNTIGQLALTAGLLARNGRRAVRRSLDDAVELAPEAQGSGEPTPLWHLPALTAALTVAFSAPAYTKIGAGTGTGWDAGLRIAGGTLLAGLAQAMLFERLVAAAERSQGRTYYRVSGSRLGRGTNLGWTPGR